LSQEDVEIVRRFVAETNEAGEAFGQKVHPDIEWHLDSDHPDQQVLHGPANVATYFRDWFAAFDHLRVEVGDYRDHGRYVVMPFVVFGRLRGSNEEVPLAETWAFRVRDGLIVEVREYLSLAEALKDIGLEA